MGSRFDVAIVIYSTALSLNEIESILGCAGSGGSHDKGEVRHDASMWKTTRWRKDATDHAASVLAKSTQLLNEWGAKSNQLRATQSDEITVVLDLAAYFDTANCTLELPDLLVSKLAVFGIGAEISVYPCEFAT